MRKTLLVLALMALAGMVLALEMPPEEECANEIETALKNIEIGRRNLAGSDYTSAGVCYENRKEYGKALDCFIKSAGIFTNISDIRAAAAYSAVGETYMTLGDEKKAKEYYNLAINRYLQEGDKFKDISLADVYLKLGDEENACKYCKMDSVYTYEDCVKQKYCNDVSFGSSSSGGFDYGSNGGLPLIPIAVVIVFLLAIAGFFLTKKKRK